LYEAYPERIPLFEDIGTVDKIPDPGAPRSTVKLPY